MFRYMRVATATHMEVTMSGKLLTAMVAAILLASTGLASAQTNAARYNGHKNDPYSESYRGYYNLAPGYVVPNNGWDNIDRFYPFPVTGQSGA